MTSGVEQQRVVPCPDCEHLCSREAVSCPNCGKPFSKQTRAENAGLDDHIFEHILSQSSTRVGMCLTLLGLVKVVEGVKSVRTITDELLAVDALGFLLSSILTYFALKQRNSPHKQKFGKAGDLIFTASLFLLLVICVVVAIEML